MRLKNKNVLVYGLGRSGRAVITVLRENGAFVSFYDDNIDFLGYVGFEKNPFGKTYDFVVVSPGVKCIGNKLLEDFQRRNIPILSELDFGFLLCKGKVIGITGTNGKTTVSMLTHKILKTAGYDSVLCGNIGLPLSMVAKKTTRKTVVVCEVSNFQLELSRFFRANIACVTNLKPDHIDRHGSFEEYRRVKSKICQNMKWTDNLVLNFDDEEAKYMIFHKKFEYFSKQILHKGTYVKNDFVYHNKKKLFDKNIIRLLGEKNLENVLASVAICSNFNVKKQDYEKAISSFVPASHRMEIVGKVGEVTFVDDSKATNVSSTVACALAFSDKSIILLLGGQGKDISYDEIFTCGVTYKKIVCFGQEAENIAKTAKKYNCSYETFSCLKDAVLFASNISKKGDFVLLSPACSSFDEFESYAERGEKFKEFVLEFVNEK